MFVAVLNACACAECFCLCRMLLPGVSDFASCSVLWRWPVRVRPGGDQVFDLSTAGPHKVVPAVLACLEELSGTSAAAKACRDNLKIFVSAPPPPSGIGPGTCP